MNCECKHSKIEVVNGQPVMGGANAIAASATAKQRALREGRPDRFMDYFNEELDALETMQERRL